MYSLPSQITEFSDENFFKIYGNISAWLRVSSQNLPVYAETDIRILSAAL